LIDALKPVDLDRFLADNNDDGDDVNDDGDDEDEDDHDHDHDDDDHDDDDSKIYGKFNRPMITLSGPYHYQVKLNFFEFLKFPKKFIPVFFLLSRSTSKIQI
jgi:hypothetical protein